jgi:hypothetical protein
MGDERFPTSRRKTVDDDTSQSIDSGYQPCMDCRHPTLRAILAQHGARCIRCYETWCSSGECGSGELGRALTAADKLAIVERVRSLGRDMAARHASDPRGWARDLIERAERGEHVSFVQHEMACRALGIPKTPRYAGSDDAIIDDAETERFKREMQRKVDEYRRTHGL